MPSLRFANPDLQAQFLAGVKKLPFSVEFTSDGSVVCNDEQWPAVNDVAHKIRDTCFKWYFSWCDTADGARDFEEHLKSNELRHELEYHEGRTVFLLPKIDRDKHHIPDSFTGPRECSFCKAPHTERARFFATDSAAICDECIRWLHEEMQSP